MSTLLFVGICLVVLVSEAVSRSAGGMRHD